MQYTKVNDLTWMHTLLLWLPKANFPKRTLVILLIRETQHCLLLKFINFNLSLADSLHTVKLTLYSNKLSVVQAFSWGFKLKTFSFTPHSLLL